MTVLEVQDLRVVIDTADGRVRAVRGLDLTVAAGEAVGLVGESGCGKSVSALAIMGLLPRSAKVAGGRVLLSGSDLLAFGEERMRDIRGDRVAMVFQDPLTSLNPTMNVGRQLCEPLERHRGATRAAARARAVELLGLVGIPDGARRLDDYPHQFSGGMRQRLMLAMALMCQPELLIADEPTTALDVTIQAQILELLDSLRTEFGMALLIITHDLGVVAGITDRVVVMYAGRAIEEAPTEELLESPRHPYTRGLLASVARLDRPRGLPLQPIDGMPPDLGGRIVGCAFRPRCPRAVERCEGQPPFVDVRPGHRGACWALAAEAGAAASSPGLSADAARTGPTLDPRTDAPWSR